MLAKIAKKSIPQIFPIGNILLKHNESSIQRTDLRDLRDRVTGDVPLGSGGVTTSNIFEKESLPWEMP